METGSFTPSLAVPRVGAVERYLSGRGAPPACPFPRPVLAANTRHKCAKIAATLQVPIDARNRTWNMGEMALGSQRGSHRDQKSRAVLSAVNALRSASTPPGPAGPAGIDSACARHVMGNCAMAHPNGFGPSVSGGGQEA